MFKRLLLITLSITILLTSVSAVYAESEAGKMPDYEVILSDSKVERLIDFDFDDKPGYFDNISEAEDRKSIIDSEHKVSHTFPKGGNTFVCKKLSEPASEDVVFINFDFRIDENVHLFYIRLLNSAWTGNTVENDPNMTETFAVQGANAGYYGNSNLLGNWAVTKITELTLNEWHNITMWLDLATSKLYFVIDNEFIDVTGSNPTQLTDFSGILFSKQGATEAFIDNLNVAAVDRAYLENFSANGVNVPDDLKDTVTVRADIGELGNAFYEKNKEIPTKISVFNRLSVPQDLKVLAKAKTRSGEDVKDYEFDLTVESKSTETIEFNLAGMDKYGYNDLHLEVYSKETNELVGKDVYEYALINTPPEGLRNQKVGIIDHARPANARLGDPIINAEFASRVGFATTRSEHDWEQYEQEKGVYQLSDLYKKLFAYKRSQNMGHLDILTAANSLYGSDNPPSTPATIEGFKNYAVAIVGDLIKESGGNELEVEIWNEYNNYGTWFNPDDQPASMYYELIKATYPALKEKYPDIRVWGMSTLGVDIKWMEEVLKLGGGEYMDGISIHPYTMKEMPDLGNAILKLVELKEVLKKYGYTHETMPFRATEWGWSSIGVDGYLNEAEQASAFIRMMVLNDHYDLFEQIDWYTINDGGDQPTQEHGFGLIRWMDGRIPYGVKPSYLTASNYNALMTDAVYEKNLKIGDDVESYKYTLRDGRDCVVAWVKQPDGKETVSVDLGADSATLMDAYGNEKIVYSNNGIFSLQYTQMPQYLIGDFTKYEKGGRAFELSSQTLNIPSGDSASLLFYQYLGNKVRLEVEGTSDVSVSNISGFEGNVAEIAFKSKGEGSDKESIIIRAYDGNTLLLEQEVPVQYIEPVDVQTTVKPESFENPNFWQIEFNINNHYSDKKIKGTLNIEEPYELKKCVENLEFEVEAGQSQNVKINIPDAIIKTKTLELKGSAAVDSGVTVPISQNINLESCIYVESPPEIDGKLDKDEWSEAASIDLGRGKYVYLDGNSYGGSTDLTGKLYTAWDEEYLYLAADMTDDVYAQDNIHGGVFWRSDGIQISFAKYKGIRNVSQFDIAKINGEDRITVERSPDEELIGELSKDKYVLKISNEGNSTIYEAKIPWTVIFPDGYTAAKNGELAITLLVNDNDGSVREGYLEFGSGMGTGTIDTSRYISFYMLGKALIEDLK